MITAWPFTCDLQLILRPGWTWDCFLIFLLCLRSSRGFRSLLYKTGERRMWGGGEGWITAGKPHLLFTVLNNSLGKVYLIRNTDEVHRSTGVVQHALVLNSSLIRYVFLGNCVNGILHGVLLSANSSYRWTCVWDFNLGRPRLQYRAAVWILLLKFTGPHEGIFRVITTARALQSAPGAGRRTAAQ